MDRDCDHLKPRNPFSELKRDGVKKVDILLQLFDKNKYPNHVLNIKDPKGVQSVRKTVS